MLVPCAFMRVLYLHGLESGPGAGKAKNLQQGGVEVVCPQLPNSAENVQRDPAGTFRDCLAKAREALAEGPFDCVVGSSYGGAVLHALLRDGDWRGPSVVLCPAWKKCEAAVSSGPPRVARGLSRAVVVVHGRQDEVIPYEDSVELCAASGAHLVSVDDDHRLSATATTAGLLTWVRSALG